MYQPAGAVPQETIDSSTLGRKGSFISFFNLNVCKGMCVCMCVCVYVCVCVSVDRFRNFSLLDLFQIFLVLLFPGQTRVLTIELTSWKFLLFCKAI